VLVAGVVWLALGWEMPLAGAIAATLAVIYLLRRD
jgi:hypothetical protein